MLIRHPRQTARDIEAWERAERADAVHGRTSALARRVAQAESAVAEFAMQGPCYLGVSWGKDSVCVADIVARVAPTIPFVYVRVSPLDNPDCETVRDHFLAAHPCVGYHEITVTLDADPTAWSGFATTGATGRGFETAAARFGDRYVSGVRGAESGDRKRRMAIHGISSKRTCAPIGWWSGADVFGYLHARGLPVHPAYACSMGGALNRDRIRVSSLLGQKGNSRGRAEWETLYYRDEVERIASIAAPMNGRWT